jgi:nitrogen fixation/metabolism regulation signal transduction histidine kinase
VQWTLTVFIVGVWTGCSFSVRHRVVLPLQTLSNLLAALRESDFSIRARGASGDDPLGAVMLEVNVLASTLHDQRLGALEASALLRTVMVEIDVAVFTFDGAQTLRLVNRAGERLLAQPAEQLLGRTAAELELRTCLDGVSPRIEDVVFPGGAGRYEVRRTTFRQGGRPHQLLVLADVSRPLRDEERQAWQRLIRVIGHEINNSLAPIKSIAGSLESILARYTGPDPASASEHGDPTSAAAAGVPSFGSDPETIEDMKRGLAVIAARSDSLSRFTTAYARLAKLPAPRVDTVNVPALVRRIAGVETRLPIHVAGPDLQIRADPDQLEQLLINLVHNASDAALQTGGAVTVGWKREGRGFELWIDDEGSGLTNASNLFVPFFTTKPGGSGIGLVLSRQIAEAHGGTLTLENRVERRGCRAYLRLPV